ncbi:MFS transporter [Lentibacillus cibarius]|uniref:MFS transporter n=1 Tax=Lentibacillus cibarius TaxID=2583219 RepID=A0A5S3QND9_9BACI|nr:MFS transporter [Lentibacillus cibarius]TMN23178.1 MFS transporter [Lentibacillus cibarius]
MGRKKVRRRKVSISNKILLLLCGLYFIAYVDRVNIATAAPFIEDDLNLSSSQMGFILSAFAYPYCFLQIAGGWAGDKLGPRKMLSVIGIVVAGTTAITGAISGMWTAMLARIGLGVGEGAAFPTATKAMTKWLPREKWGFGQGATHASSRLGNAITPPLIAAIIVSLGWRSSFFIMALISALWVIVWLWYFRDNPKNHPKITNEELAALPPQADTKEQKEKKVIPWKQLSKRILPITLIDFCYGWALWVYLTWLPSFLYTAYQIDIQKSAIFTAGILFAGVVGDALGGGLSDKIYKKTSNLKFARKSILITGLAGSFIFLLPALFIHNLMLIAISLSLAFFFLELCNANLWAIPMDIAPNHSGTASGMMNTGFGIAGMVSPLLFGFMIDVTGNWQVPFSASIFLLFVGIVVTLLIDPSKKVDLADSDEENIKSTTSI